MECSNNDIQAFNNSLEKIVQDRKIDGVDISEIETLFSLYNKDCLESTQTELKNIFSETLKKGYTVRNKNDIVVLEKMLKIIGFDYKLSENYDSLLMRNMRPYFSVTFDGETLHYFTGENATNQTLRRIGTITPEGVFKLLSFFDSAFSIKNSLDHVYDNNNIPEQLLQLKQQQKTSGNDGKEEDCKVCVAAPKSTLDFKRQIVNGIDADENYRKNVSDRWMQTKKWKDLVVSYNQNLPQLTPNSEIVTEMTKILSGGYTSQDIQNLQHCLGMLASNGQAQDSKESQDGMLGPNTTQSLQKWISLQCKK